MENPIVQYILDNPLPFITFVIMLFFIILGKVWHAMYAYCIVILGYVVLSTVGISQFISGVVVGVIANELFGFIKKHLAKENGKST